MNNKLSLLIAICLVSSLTQAQTNTFPSSGNAGVGTTTPADQLEVVNGNRKVGFNTPVSGAVPGGILSLSRPDDGTKIMLLGGSASPTDDGVLYTAGGGTELRLVSAGGTSGGFGFYTNISSAAAFGSTRPAPVMKIDGTGNLGVGTNTPSAKLHININGSSTNYAAYASTDVGLVLQNGNSTANNLNLLAFTDASGWGVADLGTITNHASHSAKLFFSTRPAGSGPLQRMIIDENGNVGIGSLNPNQKLTVNGTIYGKEVKVDLNVPGPDYVFLNAYSLRSLAEVEDYIKTNQHLPEVPSAAQMEKEGINVSEMNMLLLKKVEELTLYLIKLDKEHTELTKKFEELEKLKK